MTGSEDVARVNLLLYEGRADLDCQGSGCLSGGGWFGPEAAVVVFVAHDSENWRPCRLVASLTTLRIWWLVIIGSSGPSVPTINWRWTVV